MSTSQIFHNLSEAWIVQQLEKVVFETANTVLSELCILFIIAPLEVTLVELQSLVLFGYLKPLVDNNIRTE